MRLSLIVLLGLLPSTFLAQTPVAQLIQPDTTACPAPAPGDTSRAPDPRGRADSAAGPAASPSQTPATRNPAVTILASAAAREVRFGKQPRIRIRLCGGVMDSVRVLERRNLPDPVVAGTTYRDVYVAVEILGHLHADCILERLGVATPAERDRACAMATASMRGAPQPAAPGRRP